MKVKTLVIVLIAAMLAIGYMPVFTRFTISDERSGHIAFQDKPENYREFYVSFTHSVNRTPVNEYYRISGDKFVLEKATFYSYGAGMPETGEYGSGKPSIKDGMVQIEGINKTFKKFTYIAGTYANHSLKTADTQIAFSSFVKPQTPVTFEVKKISLITMLRLYRTPIST